MASLLAHRSFTARTAVAPKCFAASACAPRAMALVRPTASHQSSFLGGSLVANSPMRPGQTSQRGALIVQNVQLGNTTGGNQRCTKRVSGFRKRMQTTNGKKVLARRRAKGRAKIAPASMRDSGGKKRDGRKQKALGNTSKK